MSNVNFLLTSVRILPNTLSVTVFAICALAGVFFFRKRTSRPQHFPSPPSDPIFGHLRFVPSKFQWLTYTEWAKQLGDIVHISIVGHPIIILNTAEAARDLMERRGANYSDRPTTILHGKMINWGDMLVFTRYGDQFRTQRRLIHQYLNSQASVSLRPLQTEQVKILLKNLLLNPSDFRKHINRMSSTSIVKFTYGYDIVSDDDEYVNLAVEATSRGVAAGIPGMTPVDLFPMLQYIPSWFPGASFKIDAKTTRKLSDEMIYGAYDRVKEERASGTAQPSLLNTLLEDYEKANFIDKNHEQNMRFSTGNMYAAGVESSDVSVVTFILMMVQNPEVVKRAQAEIDRVVRTDQLPTTDDRPNLPYVESILKEVFRINPPFPLSLPHRALKEDVYRDKFKPADSFVLANVWHMMRDERYYQNSERFMPERFLQKVTEPEYNYVNVLNSLDADDPSSLVFEFGRRICPGRFFADTSVWLVIANILAVFDILPVIDPDTGKEKRPVTEYISGFTNKPKPFDCRIIPRSAKHVSLINQECS